VVDKKFLPHKYVRRAVGRITHCKDYFFILTSFNNPYWEVNIATAHYDCGRFTQFRVKFYQLQMLFQYNEGKP